MSLPLRYDVDAVLLADGRAEATAVGERIRFDASSEPSPLPGPAHLLAAAFAGCLLKNFEQSAAFLRFRYANASVRATLERRGSSPSFSRLEYVLELETEEPPARLELVHRNALRYGPVVSTLAKACTVEGEARVRAPAAA